MFRRLAYLFLPFLLVLAGCATIPTDTPTTAATTPAKVISIEPLKPMELPKDILTMSIPYRMSVVYGKNIEIIYLKDGTKCGTPDVGYKFYLKKYLKDAVTKYFYPQFNPNIDRDIAVKIVDASIWCSEDKSSQKHTIQLELKLNLYYDGYEIYSGLQINSPAIPINIQAGEHTIHDAMEKAVIRTVESMTNEVKNILYNPHILASKLKRIVKSTYYGEIQGGLRSIRVEGEGWVGLKWYGGQHLNYLNLSRLTREYDISHAKWLLEGKQKIFFSDIIEGDTYLFLSLLYKDIKKFEEAFAAAKKGLEFFPNHFFPYHVLALIYREQGKYSEAENNFRKVIEINPDFMTPYYQLASMYLDNENYYQAINVLRKAIEIDKNDFNTLWLLSKAYIHAGKYKEVTDILSNIEADQAVPFFFALRAFAYRELGQRDAFLKDAEQAYLLNPNDSWARSAMAVLLIDKGNYDQALKILSTVKDSNFDKVLEAIAYAKVGDFSNAVRLYQDIPEDYLQTKSEFRKSYIASLQNLLKPYKDSRLQVARDMEKRGQYKEAIKEYAEYLRLADEKEAKEVRAHIAELMVRYPHLFTLPEEARKAVIRAEAYTSEGKFEKAIEEYKNALKLQPFFPALYKALALTYAQLKDYKKAIRNMNIYLELYPDAPDARLARDEIYRWEFLMEKGE